MSYKRWTLVLLTCVLALGLTAGPAYATSQTTSKRISANSHATKTDMRAAMVTAANTYFKNSPVPVISAPAVYAAVQTKDASYQIVDVRSATDYERGHIEGAINIPFKTTADDASLALLDPAKTIVVVCYTGETASMTTMLWSMLGYKAEALMYGMSGWVADASILGMPVPSGLAAGYKTTARPTLTHKTFHAPKLKGRYASVAQAVKGQARAYFAKDLSPVISAAAVHKITRSHSSRYQIVSVRQKADYATGHIKGATNIVWTDIADQMTKLNPKKTTIVYCYTGNTGAEASMFLNLMGYRTYNMMSGMAAWNSDPAVGGFVGYNPLFAANYPTVK